MRPAVLTLGGFRANSPAAVIEPLAVNFLRDLTANSPINGETWNLEKHLVAHRAPFSRCDKVTLEFDSEATAKAVLAIYRAKKGTGRRSQLAPLQEGGQDPRLQPDRPRAVRVRTGKLFGAEKAVITVIGEARAEAGMLESVYGRYVLLWGETELGHLPPAAPQTPGEQPDFVWHTETLQRVFSKEEADRIVEEHNKPWVPTRG